MILPDLRAAGLTVAAVLLSTIGAAAVEHTPLRCVPADRYARITARAAAASVEVHFRSPSQASWYATRMAPEAGEWVGFLPRPAPSLGAVEYRIVAIAADGGRSATDPVQARVGGPGECDEAGRASVESPIVVDVPPGAPLTPPVPAGFSPAGVVRAEARRRASLPLVIGGAVVAAGVAVAVAAGTSEATSGPPPTGPLAVPEIRLNAVDPPAGSTVSVARDRITAAMRLAAPPTSRLIFQWRFEILSAGGQMCAFVEGHAGAPEGIDLVLTGSPVIFGGCGTSPPFDSQRMRIAIRVNQDFVYDETLALPYHFEP